MFKLIKLLLLCLVIIFISSGIVLAQATSPEVTEAINLDENIQAEDLEIGEPAVLPDHPLYFLKNLGRRIQIFFILSPIRQAELRMKFANERLMEIKKLIALKKNPEIIKRATENYQNEVNEIKIRAERLREKAQENPQVEKFLDKFIHQQTLHQKLLQKLENQVSPEAFEKIKTSRERHLEIFQEVMLKLEDRKDQVTEKLDEILEQQKGSKYKHFKNLEILLELEDKVPEVAKEAIQKTQENTLKRLKGDLERMSTEDQEIFKEYLEKIGGVEEKHLEIMETLRQELKNRPEIIEQIMQIREGVMERVQEQIRLLNCPLVEKPASDFCKEGRIVAKKDSRGCIISFGCVIPSEVEIPPTERPEVCIALWDPVCGKDGKTYSNACFAKLAEVEIAYKGKCEEVECKTDADCPQPRCGPTGTISVRCIGVKAECLEGKCQLIQL